MRDYPSLPLSQRLLHQFCDRLPSLDVDLLEYPHYSTEFIGTVMRPAKGKFFLVLSNYRGVASATLWSEAELVYLERQGMLEEAIAHKVEEIKNWLC